MMNWVGEGGRGSQDAFINLSLNLRKKTAITSVSHIHALSGCCLIVWASAQPKANVIFIGTDS